MWPHGGSEAIFAGAYVEVWGTELCCCFLMFTFGGKLSLWDRVLTVESCGS